MIRIPGKFGNINPDLLPPPPEGTPFNNPYLTSWMQFINAIKYPPDLAFATLYMGLDHLAFAGFYILPTTATSKVFRYLLKLIVDPLVTFGQSALFFYMIHFHVYQVIGPLFLACIPGCKLRVREGWFWIYWMVGLTICRVLCSKYAEFKARKGPDSIWRFL
ncbi:6765_t:CDS:1 [Acaulospora colombiana]|uniref:6765_t:CDS:1 n=1 Tax=Acaulospora colombiana TaxID=27376 RepID=A0ACA9LM63_9GLOM|nr:6765_t:CDS:1 [Acaulospora colombiana]